MPDLPASHSIMCLMLLGGKIVGHFKRTNIVVPGTMGKVDAVIIYYSENN
jgi:hypothetical protein